MEARDLGIYREVPTAARLTSALNRGLMFLVEGPAAIVVGVAGIIGLAMALSHIARVAVANVWFSIGLVILLAILMIVLGTVVNLKTGKLVLGRPEFGKLGGSPSRVYRTTVMASAEMEFEFDDDDKESMERLVEFDIRVSEAQMRKMFEQLARDSGTYEEGEWQRIWDTEILGHRTGESTLGDVLAGKSYAFQILAQRFTGVLELTNPLRFIYLLVVTWLVASALEGSISLLPAFQAGLVLSLVISLVVFLNFMIRLGATIPIETEKQLSILPPEFHDEARELGAKEVTPRKARLTEKYFSIVRDFMAQTMLRGGLVDMLLLIILIGVSLGASLVFAADSRAVIISQYGKLLLALPLILGGLLVGHYIAFLVLKNLGQFLAPVVGGVAVAVVPLLLDFATTGTLKENPRTILIGIGSGMVTAVVSSLTNRIKGATQAK